MKNIYIPKYDDSSDEHQCEFDENEDEPIWHRHFDPDELLHRYEPIVELDRGSYGIRYSGIVLQKRHKLQPKTKIAIKKYRRVFHTESDAKRLLRELRTLRVLGNHCCILKLYDIISPKDPRRFHELTLILECFECSLDKVFRTNQFWTTQHIQYMLYQILLGIKYIHSAKIAHCDLKPSNILINTDCRIKITNFERTRTFDEHQSVDRASDVIENANVNTKESKRSRKRLLTKKKRIRRSIARHVPIHWWRAPEVIILQQKQTNLAAADMWSVGAIFAELLQMQRENSPEPSKRSPLFPGESCYPKTDELLYSYHRVDQMQRIFDVIGSPNKEEIHAFSDEKAREYLRCLPQRKKNLKRMFPGADKYALDLFKRLCAFAVDKRSTADQALDHGYFKSVRDSAVHRRKKRKPLNLRFDGMSLGEKKLRELILEEVMKYNYDDECRFIDSGAMPNYKKMRKKQLKPIFNGYIRKYIEPLFVNRMVIPVDVIDICYVFYCYL